MWILDAWNWLWKNVYVWSEESEWIKWGKKKWDWIICEGGDVSICDEYSYKSV